MESPTLWDICILMLCAGSSSVPAHVEMMGFLGIGNNPMIGVIVAVNIQAALSK